MSLLFFESCLSGDTLHKNPKSLVPRCWCHWCHIDSICIETQGSFHYEILDICGKGFRKMQHRKGMEDGHNIFNNVVHVSTYGVV
mmetsp:Transcript_81021/g.135555  ORF Transcript_81021/g.135555 Transcript_81021/m.135555 type:complete len:85 (-) Transcript_81021:214-468(-)